MKSKWFMVPVLAAALAAGALIAPKKAEAEGLYVGGDVGMFMPADNTIKTAYGNMFEATGKIGYDWNSVRLALFGRLAGKDKSEPLDGGWAIDSELTETTVGAELTVDLTRGSVRPYLTSSFGYKTASETLTPSYEGMKGKSETQSESAVSTSGGIGVEAQITNGFSMSAHAGLESAVATTAAGTRQELGGLTAEIEFGYTF